MAAYLIVAFFVLLFASTLYITFSTKMVHNTGGQIVVRVGWAKFLQRDDVIYRISDDFAYHEYQVQDPKLMTYIKSVIENNRCRQRPDSIVVKRFLRKHY